MKQLVFPLLVACAAGFALLTVDCSIHNNRLGFFVDLFITVFYTFAACTYSTTKP
jgi:hypothetical protein